MAKDNAVNDEGLVRTVQQHFYMENFLKSIRFPQEAVKIYQKIRDILIKDGFNLTKWVTGNDEVKSQIRETDRSTKSLKTFEAEPQSSSILRLIWNVVTDSLIVCRGTGTKITQKIVLSFVSALFDPLGICSPFTIQMRFLLKSFWAAMRPAWEKNLSAENSTHFSDWCSDWREKRTMSINRLYFENDCLNLRLHIFTTASEEAMCIVAYLQDKATLKLTFAIGKWHVAPIRHMTTPSRSLRSSSQKVDTQQTWCQNWQNLSLYQLINKTTVATSSAQQVFIENRAAEILETSSMDQWRHAKGVENHADIRSRGISIEGLMESLWLNGPQWLHTDEEKWPKPWCQVKEAEAEQVISTVATQIEIDKLFDWRQKSSFNQVRNFIAYCKRLKTKQKGPLKAHEVHQAEQILFRFVQSFPKVDCKQERNHKNFEHSQTVTLHRGKRNYLSESLTKTFESRLHCKTSKNYWQQNIQSYNFCRRERIVKTYTRASTGYVRTILQQVFWIVGLRKALMKIKSRCIKCRHKNANPIHPPMADLPRERLDEHVFPLTNTGVGIFGHFEVKLLRRTLMI